MKPVDEEILTLLDKSAVTFQVVLTKADKPKAAALEKISRAVASDLTRHVAAHPAYIVASSVTGAGLATLRAEIEHFVRG